MKKKANEKHFIKKPTYIGGLKAMRQFIAKEMKYPKSALENKIEGTVFLKYEVDYKGKVVSSKVLNNLGYGCDEEAQRIISKLKFYVGKNPRKLKIKFNKTIKIHFRLPKEKKVSPKKATQNKPKQNSQNLVYTITSPTKQEATKPKEKGYSYTIRY